MKKIIIISIIVICLIIGGVVCFLNCGEKGKQLELTYTTNGGVPYKWEYEIEDETIIKFVKSYEIENQNNDDIVGAPISTNYVFKGLKEGKTSIIFQYVSIVDGSIDKQEKLYVKVDKNKNVSLIAKKNDLE
jgi:predicted secreted protein